MNLSKSSRSFIAQVRSGTLPINIEIGRFQQKEIDERICPACNSNCVEDEFHFIFDCPLYAGIRTVFMDFTCDKIRDFEKKDRYEQLKVMMSDCGVISKFGVFIRDCYMLRSNFLYTMRR